MIAVKHFLRLMLSANFNYRKTPISFKNCALRFLEKRSHMVMHTVMIIHIWNVACGKQIIFHLA